MTKVKICGITNGEDAIKAAELGADYLGFLIEIDFSEDSIDRVEAKKIIQGLPLEVQPVMVTYLQDPIEIVNLAKELQPAVIQLHNYLPLEDIKKIKEKLENMKITKTVHVTDENAVKEAKEYEPFIDFILLDTKTKEKLGGSGQVHDWSISRKIAETIKKPVFLAGGLNPTNVEQAINEVKPYAVDTNSGVKKQARKKDYEKMQLFIEKAKKCVP